MFFDLASAGLLDGRTVTLSDVNADLIGCYRAVRDDTDAVIAALQALEREHRRARRRVLLRRARRALQSAARGAA